jgi:hypothetical protein
VVVFGATAQSAVVAIADPGRGGPSARDLSLAVLDGSPAFLDAELVTTPVGGTSHALLNTPAAGLRGDGNRYAVLATGRATALFSPDSSGQTTTVLGNTARGAYDVTVLRVDIEVPATANCLLGLDFRFLSEEYPGYVGSRYGDAFVAELDRSTWTVDGDGVSAPDSFAVDPAGQPVGVGSVGPAELTSAAAAGTTFDGATPLLRATTPITPGRHSVFLSVFDTGDGGYDSAVLLDNLRLGRVPDVDSHCRQGARPVPATPPDVGLPVGVGTASAGDTIALPAGTDSPGGATAVRAALTEAVAAGAVIAEAAVVDGIGPVEQGRSERSRFTVRPRETVTTAFDVDDRLDWARVLLQWEDGDVRLSLTAPSGVVYDRTRPPARAVQDNGPTWDLVEVPDPERGRWTAALHGVDVAVPGAEVTVTVALSAPVNAPPTAAMTMTSDGHSLVLDASASTDLDGTVVDHDWFVNLPRSEQVHRGKVVTLSPPAGQPLVATLVVTDDRGAVATLTRDLVPLDISPGEVVNRVDPDGGGELSMGLLAGDGLDLAGVDTGSLLVGRGRVAVDPTEVRATDVDGDGLTDLVLRVPVRELGLADGDTALCLSGTMTDGTGFSACDRVELQR